MRTNALKLSLRKDTLRVLSSAEMCAVIGGVSFSPAQAQAHTTFASIHCTAACDGRNFAVAAKPVTTAAMLR